MSWPTEEPATDGGSSVATIRARTVHRPGRRAPETRTWDDPDGRAAMEEDVARAREGAGLVILSRHGGVSSREASAGDRRQIARAAVAAGAGLVYGPHPHRIWGPLKIPFVFLGSLMPS